MPRFDRQSLVTIGPPGETGLAFDQRFRTAFTVRKSDTQDANRIDVSLYGLSDDTRARLLSTENVIEVQAGYAAGLELLAFGGITAYNVQRNQPDVVTVFEAGDGIRTLRDRLVTLSFGAGAAAGQIIDAITQQLDLGFRDTGADVSGQYAQGFSFTGRAKDALDKVTRRFGLRWSIQNGELQIVERGQIAVRRAVVLTPSTGLVGSPQRLDDVDILGEDQQPGWRVESLLQPKIEPAGIIELDSREAQGEFRVVTVEHFGDTRGPEWRSVAEVVQIER